VVDLEGLDGTAKGMTCRGVFTLDGDVLHVTYAAPGDERSAGLDPKDPLASRMKLKRMKE
jgi:hypothetical protein